MSLNNSPTSIQTNNLFDNTNTNTNSINDMDTFLKNFQLYKLLKDESEKPNSIFIYNNEELKKFLNRFEIDFFLLNEDIFNDSKKLTKLKQIADEAVLTKIDSKKKNKNLKGNNNLDNYFEEVKERIANGETLWSEYQNLNKDKALQFTNYINRQYGINFQPIDDNDARYNILGKLDITSSSKSGGFYKRSKKSKRRKGIKSIKNNSKKRNIKRKQKGG